MYDCFSSFFWPQQSVVYLINHIFFAILIYALLVSLCVFYVFLFLVGKASEYFRLSVF